VSETAEDDVRKQFITDIDVVDANETDSEAVDEIQRRLIARNLRPNELYVDRGYISGANLAHSADRGTKLVGQALPDTSCKPEGYKQTDFKLDFERKEATCPEGRVSEKWYERPQADGHVGAEIQFKGQCEGCPARAQCAPSNTNCLLKDRV
jgi:hypothetical protein